MISQDEAVAIATKRARERGWGMREPVAVTIRRSWLGRLRSYEIVSDPRMRGTKARVTVDAQSGAIIAEGYLKR